MFNRIIFRTLLNFRYDKQTHKRVSLSFSLEPVSVSLSEHHAKLGRVGSARGKDLPAAGLELVGDGAVTSESDLVGCGGNGPELEDRYVCGSGDLDGAVHAGNVGGFRAGILWGFGFGFGFGLLLLGLASEPR